MKNKKYFLTSGEFAKMNGINKRTLHYYNDIGLFRPEMIDENGYHYYSRFQAVQLEMILIFRRLGLSIEEIRTYTDHPSDASFTQIIREKQELIDRSVCQLLEVKAFLQQKQEKLALGLSAMGLTYGMAYGFAFEYAGAGIELSAACLLVNGILGAVVLVYALRFGKNFGYSSANLAILPIAGFAQCMIAVMQTELLPVSFFCMRLAYVLFDVVLWLQLQKVFAHIGTIRTFLVARLFLEGSVAVGIVVREALAHTGFLVFDLVSLAVVALLLTALTLSFHGGGIGSVWDLMPEPLQYSGKFRNACQSISDRHGLTPREAEVMRLVMRGRSGAYVQENLFISKSTFQTHMRNLYKKLDVHTNQELLDLLEATLDEQRSSGK